MSLTKVSYSMIQGAVANVLDYGAVGDGIANDTAAVQNAVGSGKSVVYFPAGTYNVDSTIVVPPNVSLVGEGKATVIDGTAISVALVSVISQTGSVTNTTTLTGNVAFGATSFTVTSVAGMVVGGWISLLGDTAYSWSGPWAFPARDYRKQTFFQIIGISGTTITVNEPTNTTFESADTVVSVLSPTTAYFKDFKIVANTSNQASAMNVSYGLDVLFDNVICEGGDVLGLGCSQSINTTFRKCSVFLDAVGSGLQYGISIATCDFTVVDDCDLYATRHAVAIVGNQTRRTKVVNSRLRGLQYAADAHGNVDDLVYENCVISEGVLFGGRDCSYINCKIICYSNTSPVLAREIYGGSHTMQGCELVWSGSSLPAGFSPIDFSQAQVVNVYTKEDVTLNFVNNQCYFTGGVSNYFIRIRNASAYKFNVNVRDNFAYFPSIAAVVRYEGAPTGSDADYAVVTNTIVAGALNVYTTFSQGAGASGYATSQLNLTNTYSGAATPSTGYWNRGDIMWNTGPSAGGNPGWVCVTSGSPGTWKAMANLAA